MLRQQVRSDRGPNRALLRLLVDKYTHLVVYVDEYYTSQVRIGLGIGLGRGRYRAQALSCI